MRSSEPGAASTELEVAFPAQTAARVDTTLIKGMRVLETLSSSATGMSVSAVSAEFGIVKSNAHRVLRTLAELGYVRQDPVTRLYSASLKMWEIGSQVVERHVLSRASLQIMRNLSKESGESVYMAILSGVDVLYLDYVSTNPMQPKPAPGQRTTAIFTAAGRAILAHQKNPVELIDQAIASVPRGSEIDRLMILRQLEDVRKSGFAISSRAVVPGWAHGNIAIAVPIMYKHYPPAAALGIGVLPNEYDTESIQSFFPMLARSAAEIAQAAGHDATRDWS